MQHAIIKQFDHEWKNPGQWYMVAYYITNEQKMYWQTNYAQFEITQSTSVSEIFSVKMCITLTADFYGKSFAYFLLQISQILKQMRAFKQHIYIWVQASV